MRFTSVFSVFLGGVVLLQLGCATYVNIPPLVGDLASHNPNAKNVLDVEVQAIKCVVDNWKPGETLVVQTLPNTSLAEQVAMMTYIGEHVMVEPVEGAPRLEVKQLCIRGFDARVDIMRMPGSEGSLDPHEVDAEGDPLAQSLDDHQDVRRLVTVQLKWGPFTGWRARRLKIWRVEVEKALPRTTLEPVVIVE